MYKITNPASAVLCTALLAAATLSGVPPMHRATAAEAVPAQPQGGRPWFGFSITCGECRMRETAAGERWSFTVPPEVQAVEAGGPADRAGLRPGDIILTIDALALTSEAGTERLAAMRAGQLATFSVRRGTRLIDVEVAAMLHPVLAEAPRVRGAERTPAPALPPRFAGSFGNVRVDVRGPANTSVMIAERECWMEIRSGQAVVRLELREGCSRR
jgi:hypothetical protein